MSEPRTSLTLEELEDIIASSMTRCGHCDGAAEIAIDVYEYIAEKQDEIGHLREVNKELLEALEVLHEQMAEMSSPATRWEHPVMKQARAAIAKAKELLK